ncbi:MAG: response regulator [Acidobacteria bacterium]|jgi:DNA-binding response OmpR family regulator|nr:response regulator [Acidobacteriota bacterium]
MRTSRIVIADDDPRVRRLLEHALHAPEFEVHAFATGAAALEALPDIRPHCVVSDMLMPDMDGEGLLRSLRAIPGLEDVPFLVVSAIRSEARIESVLGAGATAFLLKPFPVKELVGRIRSLVDHGDENEGETASEEADAEPSEPTENEPALAALLDQPADPASVPRRTELRTGSSSNGFGRFTKVEQSGRSFIVLTEIENAPQFTVTTTITEKGLGRRKIESSLLHPLTRQEDRDTVRRQVDLQHENALDLLSRLVLDGASRRIVWSDQSRSVSPSLLAWAMSALAQVAEAEAGEDEVKRALRRTLERGALREEDLRVFEVTDRGRVVVAMGQDESLPVRAIAAVASWGLTFAAEVLELDEEAARGRIRQATRSRGRELERLGFYDRVSHVAAS